MTVALIIDITLIVFTLLGFLEGIRIGLLGKIFDLLILTIIIYFTYKYGSSLSAVFATFINSDRIKLFGGSVFAEFVSSLISVHLSNILSHLVFFIIILVASKILKSIITKKLFKNKQDISKRPLNRFYGGIWGATSNLVFLTGLMVIIIPFSGLSSVVKKDTFFAKYPYNFLASIEKNLITSSGKSDENGNDARLLVIISNKAVDDNEALYIYTAIETFTSQILNKDTICQLYCNFLEYDIGTAESNASLDRYFEDIFGIVGLVKLTGRTYPSSLIEKTEETIITMLYYLENSPYQNNYIGIYKNNQLYDYIDSIFDEVGIQESIKNRVLIYFNTEDY